MLPAVLIVEDDPSITELLRAYLERAQFSPLTATTGEDALALFAAQNPVAIILDLNLPGRLDGLDVCRSLRESSDIPIVMLSARDQELDRIFGLEIGADDYVTKPFSPRELVARVRAVLRRSGGTVEPGSEATMSVGLVSVDLRRREARRSGEPVELTPREFDLLAYLLRHAGAALSRRQLLDGAWGPDWVGDERTVDVHVRQLRRKLGDDLPLQTVRNIGYRLG